MPFKLAGGSIFINVTKPSDITGCTMFLTSFSPIQGTLQATFVNRGKASAFTDCCLCYKVQTNVQISVNG